MMDVMTSRTRLRPMSIVKTRASAIPGMYAKHPTPVYTYTPLHPYPYTLVRLYTALLHSLLRPVREGLHESVQVDVSLREVTPPRQSMQDHPQAWHA